MRLIDLLVEHIGKVKGGYRLYSRKGKNLGTFGSHAAAEKHEHEVEYFKHMDETDTYQPPELSVGDRILKGKFKNSPAEIKGFTKDKHNQPVLKTNKGEVQLFKPRVTKLMDKDVTEDRPIPKAESGKAVALSNLGKFHAGVDTLGKWVPERLTHQFALDPNKWEHTFYSLTLKEPKKIRYYRPKNIDIVPGTLVGDMAIANQFYRTKDPAEQEKYALAYLASLKPYPVNLDDYEFPELLIPRKEQGVAESVNDYLWHGSKLEHEILYPRQANDTGGKKESNKNAVYATPNAKFAIAMGLTTPGSDTGMFPNDSQMVLFSGKLRKGEYVYLHKVPKDLFIKHNGREWYSKPDVKEVKPLEVVAVPVDQYLNLIRQATPKDWKLRQHYLDKAKNKEQGVAESLDNPYPRNWNHNPDNDWRQDPDDSTEVYAKATLNDGTELAIRFQKDDGDRNEPGDWSVEFARNHSQEVTGEGDEKRIFATVLVAIQEFVTWYKPDTVTFSASKDPKPPQLDSPAGTKVNPRSRPKLYNRMVQLYASAAGYSSQQREGHDKITYLLRRAKPGVAEDRESIPSGKKRITWKGIDLVVSIDGATVDIRAMTGDSQMAYVVFDRDGDTLVADDLAVEEQYKGQGIAKIMYDYVKELGFRVKRSSDQLVAGKKFWDKNKGAENNIWEQGVAEGLEEITEYRDRMYQYIKSIVPGFPDYVVKDWLYANFARGATQGPNWSFHTIGQDIPKILADIGLSVDTKWQLVPNMKFTMSMWEPKTLKRLQARAGGSSKSADPDVHIPANDAERHATQDALAKRQGGVRKEPVILIKTPQGYELLEGWHRTIQHFHKFPDGYTGPAYVAVAQGQQGVAESLDQPYSIDWEDNPNDDSWRRDPDYPTEVYAHATLDDGTPLHIFFVKLNIEDVRDNGDWDIEFSRNHNHEVTGEGDEKRIFATVLVAIQQFVKKYKPNSITFSANTRPPPGPASTRVNPQSRAKLYNTMVQRYASPAGYRFQQRQGNDKVTYLLQRATSGVVEGLNETTSQLGPQLYTPRPKNLDESMKPDSALWTSTASGSNNGYTSAWVEWAKSEMPQWVGHSGFLYDVSPSARILTINSDRDAMRVANKYGMNTTDIMDLFMYMPWKKIAKDYDAIHHVPANRGADLFMHGWDVESTAWFNTKMLLNKRKVPILASKKDVAEDTEKVNPLTNAVISFYKPFVNQIKRGAVDDYVDQARNLLNKTDDPNILSKMIEIFKKGKDHPAIQGGVVTAIAAILTGGLLTSASRMGLSPAQTNILLQAVLNTVIPTIIARINNKSWTDTIKYTLASVGVGMTAAAALSEEPVREAYTGPTLKWLKPGELRGSYTDQQMRDRGFDRAGNGKWFILLSRWNELIAKKGIQ